MLGALAQRLHIVSRLLALGKRYFVHRHLGGEATDIDYLELIEQALGDTDVSIIWNADIGHTKPSMTLINGSMGHLVMEDGRAIIEMELS